MARQDYAQKRRSNSSASRKAPTRKRPPAPPPRRAPWGLLTLVVLAVGGLGFLLLQLAQTDAIQQVLSRETQHTTAVQPVAQPSPSPAAQSAQPAAKPAQPVTQQAPQTTEPTASSEGRFEFYDMLPKSEVQTPEVSNYKSTPKTAKLETKTLLQAGSFRDPADAEKMRAQMILAGLPNVQTSRSDGSSGTWYRVRTGPFATYADVKAATSKLGTMNIHPLEIKAE